MNFTEEHTEFGNIRYCPEEMLNGEFDTVLLVIGIAFDSNEVGLYTHKV
jgi:hypothetical protein